MEVSASWITTLRLPWFLVKESQELITGLNTGTKNRFATMQEIKISKMSFWRTACFSGAGSADSRSASDPALTTSQRILTRLSALLTSSSTLWMSATSQIGSHSMEVQSKCSTRYAVWEKSQLRTTLSLSLALPTTMATLTNLSTLSSSPLAWLNSRRQT